MKHLKSKKSTLNNKPPYSLSLPFVFQKDFFIYFFIFVLAFIIRFIYLLEIKNCDLFPLLMGDAQIFDIWAKQIASGNWIGDQIFFQAPLYPYFLGFIYSVFGTDLFVVRLLQIIIGSFSCLFLALGTNYFFSKKVAILSGCILSIYPSAIFFDSLTQKTVLSLFLTTVLIYILGKIVYKPMWPKFGIAGIAVALLGLVRDNAFILVFVVLIWLFIFFRHANQKKVIIYVLAFIAGLSIIIFPITVRNKIVGGEWVLTTSNLGSNLYIGNNNLSKGTYVPLKWDHGDWQYERQDAIEIAQKDLGRMLNSSEVSNYWVKKTLSYIKSNPLVWIKLFIKKWLFIFNNIELADTESIYVYHDLSFILKFFNFFLHFGIIFPLAVIGVYLTWYRKKELWLLYFMIISLAFSIALFFVFSRYRHPMIAFFIMFASAGLINIASCFSKKQFKPVSISLFVGVVAGFIANYDMASYDMIKANTYYNVGCSVEANKDFKKAVQYYFMALKFNPHHAMALNNTGAILGKQGQFDKAIYYLNKSIDLKSDLVKAHNNLGIVLFSIQDFPKALSHFQKALDIDPESDINIYYNIACTYAKLNNIEKSIYWINKAINKGYDNWELIKNDKDLENIREFSDYKQLIKNYLK